VGFTLNADLGRDTAAIYLAPFVWSGPSARQFDNLKLALAHPTCLRHASIPALMVSESSEPLILRMRRIQASNHVDMRQVTQPFSMRSQLLIARYGGLYPQSMLDSLYSAAIPPL
jgi:hypothetical protein